MKPSEQLLSALLKTVQLGQVEIRSLLDTSMGSGLRDVLEQQLREFDSIETEAYTIALQRGWDLAELDPGRRFWKDRMTRMKLNSWDTDSRIADILILEHTKGMIRGLKHIHRFQEKDPQIRILSQKLLDCETAHIQRMQGFL